ncbi:hypothetical protein JRO89_XS12G0178400 [Xanthoceras sorbifolium]|uniref:Retrotransposon gag domain-containing protein n=1 Tax=Xanthoceras sorbifolium TaxID=99658 RepID=A0ABQ8HCY6_9ROSI|nr:hypothetical protein JRO89_XS12G0178400 [Xanthoceras sorbifolium]
MLAATLHQSRDPNVSIERARKLGAKPYDGTSDPEQEQMVTYSTFLLKDRAKEWDTRVEEFFRLEQGSMSVASYERRFSELIRAVPYIADNEEEKANRFAVGLNPKIRAHIASASHTQYGALVEAATRVERSMAAIPRP